MFDRRDFFRASLGAAAALGLASAGCRESAGDPDETAETAAAPIFLISLAEWSLNPLIFGPNTRRMMEAGNWLGFFQALQTDPDSVLGGELDHLDFAKTARDFGIEGIEYVNTFFFGKAGDTSYLQEMKNRADGEGVNSLLIMCDALGNLGDPDETTRTTAVENHFPWVEAAKYLGCHSIRVNAASEGTYEQQQRLAADGLRRLCEFAEPYDINILVENHGGLSSNGQWLFGVMDRVDHPLVGTLPDFGNFNMAEPGQPADWYDRYQGTEELMPYAKSVSAKATAFDGDGNETNTDFYRMMKIVLDAGYRGYVGVEYEGDGMTPREGIAATKMLLERVREELKPLYVEVLRS